MENGLSSVQLVTGKELASALLFEGVTGSFRKFCDSIGVRPVPGRRDCYDPVAVRHMLDRAQGLAGTSSASSDQAVQNSRARRHA